MSQPDPTHPRFTLFQVGIAILIGFVWLLGHTAAVLFSILRVQQSPLSMWLVPFVFCGLLALWVYNDSRSTGFSMGLDQGLYIFIAWPITLPLYVFMSRGLRSGCLLLVFLLGIFAITIILWTLEFIVAGIL